MRSCASTWLRYTKKAGGLVSAFVAIILFLTSGFYPNFSDCLVELDLVDALETGNFLLDVRNKSPKIAQSLRPIFLQ